MAPEGAGTHVLHHQAVSVWRILVPFRKVFDKAVKLILFNLTPLSVYLFNILWDGKKAFLLHTKVL